MQKVRNILIIFSLLAFISCGNTENEVESTDGAPKEVLNAWDDSHSHSNVAQVHSTHLHLNLTVDFDNQIISGSVVHDIVNETSTAKMIFDVRDLEVEKVILDGKDETDFQIGSEDPLLGSAMTVDIRKETKTVEIFYRTKIESEALQWLNPQQTAGKKLPYLFTQGQAVLTRTWIPCQDTPGNRITYSADIQVPEELLAVMSANNPTKKNESGTYHFEMEHPIPCYLIALAVGDLEFAELGPRTGVYTEPSLIEKCIYEFADVESMMETCEELYGEYKWGRYDIIVLPPSFPFGGMENPKLTFTTPTILAGDRSLVSLIAHELAHSWSGNLVTNATWDDFWLNEGFTVYLENRIMEHIYGKERSDMLLSIEYHDLEHENEDILKGAYPEDTHLKLDLENRNPDEGMTSIAYTKGALFLKTLEETAGRDKFDPFMNKYFQDHEFETMTSEIFVDYLMENLLEPNEIDFNVDEWVYGKGIPDNCVKIESDRFLRVEEKSIKVPIVENAVELGIDKDAWSTQEWMHFIRHIPEEVGPEKLRLLDQEFQFSNCGNSEIMAEWYVLSISRGYKGINPHMEEFLVNVGRRKFLAPIYTELSKSEEGLAYGKEIYAKARPNYHAISFNTIDEILDWKI
jgi:leukotriene-A4 hydrolase